MRVAFDFEAVIRNRFCGFYSFGIGLLQGFEALEKKPEFLLFHSRRFSKQARLIRKRLGHWAQLKATLIKMRRLEKFWRYHNYPKLEFFTGNFDIYQCFYHLMPPTKGKPRILTVHDLIRYRLPELYEKKSTLERFELAVKRADHFIAVSQSTKEDLCSIFGIPVNKVDVVHLAADEKFKPLPLDKKERIKSRLAQQVGLSVNRYLIALSSPDGRKNPERIIQAFKVAQKQLRDDIKLVIIGQIPKNNSELNRKYTSLKEQNVILTGLVNNITEWFACADGMVYASLYEGFGIPILEAFACGVPVITSNHSSMPEVADEAAVYVDPYSTESISEAIIQVCNNAELRNKLIAAGTQRCKEFNWEKSAAQMFEVYKKLL